MADYGVEQWECGEITSRLRKYERLPKRVNDSKYARLAHVLLRRLEDTPAGWELCLTCGDIKAAKNAKSALRKIFMREVGKFAVSIGKDKEDKTILTVYRGPNWAGRRLTRP